MDKNQAIFPLFTVLDKAQSMGASLIQFTKDDYNKNTGTLLINANNDGEAISSFLAEYQASPSTLQSYAKEIERLLLWCIHVKQINISSLRCDHLREYQRFLKKPTPKKLWCGPTVARFKRDGTFNTDWRPFAKGLGETTITKTLNILDSFFNYLVDANYLMGNPLALDRRRKKRQKKSARLIDRYLEMKEIHAVLSALTDYAEQRKEDAFKIIRARYLIQLLFFTGMRLAEVAEHRMGNFVQREEHWFLRITGKGKKLREIPVPDELLSALTAFRTKIGLPTPLPKFRERTPLMPMQNLKQAVTPRRIDQIVRWAFNLGAAKFEPLEPHKAEKLRNASAHWLRHSYVTYLLDSGASLKVAQENAGHSNIGTTMHYRHVAQTNRHEQTRSLSLAISGQE